MIDWTQVVTAEDKAAQVYQAEWDSLVCSRLQGRLVLGEATCATLDTIAADPATPWAMRETISNAMEWRCNSQSMDELSYLLGYTETQRLELFRIATQAAV